MKRTITLLAASLVGASGLASVAYAQDAALYGRVVSGIYYSDMEGSGTTWDLGSVDAGDLNSGDKLWSRIGVRASHDLGNGMTGGAASREAAGQLQNQAPERLAGRPLRPADPGSARLAVLRSGHLGRRESLRRRV